jgi:hypothetical protein
VARRVHIHACHAKVAWLHPRQMVYEYLHKPPTGERPLCRPICGSGTRGPGAGGNARL